MPSNFLTLPDTANTLSIFYRPGEDIRLLNTNSPSIFTFGDFRLYVDNPTDGITGGTLALGFDHFSTLDSLGAADLTPKNSYSVSPSELNLNPSNPNSYSYFGSFYTDVANAINSIIENFPYAILAYNGGSGTTIYDYTTNYNNTTGKVVTTFKIPFPSLINQGGVIINSGGTPGSISLAANYDQFAIQMSATTSAQTKILEIKEFLFSADTNAYLQFSIDDFLEGVTGSTSTLPIYIRPTQKRLANYKFTLTELEANMLNGFILETVKAEDDLTPIKTQYIWPKTIDGFNPDTFGVYLQNFSVRLLNSAIATDEAKTNMLVKTVIPENYIQLDSNQRIYATLVQTYGHEFDEIKKYIDGIAYAHSITYNKVENVPDKYLKKLSNLLGWKLSDSFNELDLFEYLSSDINGSNNTFSYYNLEIWRRILININWLYKRKGTRDAIQFIFRLLGAPDCLLRFDELTYKIEKTFYDDSNLGNIALSPSQIAQGTAIDDLFINPTNENGYINYGASSYIFQEGGTGRGNGDRYINQWRPIFDPQEKIDNIKVVVGDENVFGSQDIINSKEVCLAIDPAQGIECDVFGFYQTSGTCWVWGSFAPPFSSLTVPFEYSVDCNTIQPDNITGMTLNQYLDHIYTNSINPRNRKTLGYTDTSFFYPELRNAYLHYYMWSNPQSNRLTFHKLQPFLDLIEVSFNTYVKQLIPATTILDCEGTVIRNTVFNRQKFVYKPGVNDGSEFRTKLEVFEPNLQVIDIDGEINDEIKLNLSDLQLNATLVQTMTDTLVYRNMQMLINPNTVVSNISSFTIGGGTAGSTTQTQVQPWPPVWSSGPAGPPTLLVP